MEQFTEVINSLIEGPLLSEKAVKKSLMEQVSQ